MERGAVQHRFDAGGILTTQTTIVGARSRTAEMITSIGSASYTTAGSVRCSDRRARQCLLGLGLPAAPAGLAFYIMKSLTKGQNHLYRETPSVGAGDL